MAKINYALISDNDVGLAYQVGRGDVTRITEIEKKGPMDFLPYIQVWKGDHLHAEFALHNIIGVEYDPT